MTAGMSIDDVRRATGLSPAAAEGDQAADPRAASCGYFSLPVPGERVRLRVVQGLIDRVEVASSGFATLSGIRVGDTRRRIKVVHGAAVADEPHHYEWKQGVRLMVLGPYGVRGRRYGVAFTVTPTAGVREIWAGSYEGIRESEGCE